MSSHHPLSKKQLSQINILARQAWDHLGGDDNADVPGETPSKRFANWRHAEQAQACGKSSLKDCTQADYLPLRSHFNSILGRDDKALDDNLKSQPENDHTDPDDTPEKREQIIHLIEEQIKGTRFTLGYAYFLAKKKLQKSHISNLNTVTSKHLTQILMTIKTRVATDAKKAKA